jgi:hypothetical protein
VSTAAALLAAAAGYAVSRLLPGGGLGTSVAITALVGAAAVGLFVLVVGRFDPSTLRLLTRRRIAPPTSG